MTDEIKKMLEPKIGFLESRFPEERSTTLAVSKEQYDRLKRGFECLMEQRDFYRREVLDDAEIPVEWISDDNAELEAAMKGEA